MLTGFRCLPNAFAHAGKVPAPQLGFCPCSPQRNCGGAAVAAGREWRVPGHDSQQGPPCCPHCGHPVVPLVLPSQSTGQPSYMPCSCLQLQLLLLHLAQAK